MSYNKQMVVHYVKKAGIKIGPRQLFITDDFDCKCQRQICNMTTIDEDLVAALEELYGSVIFTINDGYRCPAHNKEVGGVPDSQHCLGRAADIKSQEAGSFGLSLLAEKVPAFSNGGIGLYNTFIHVDTRGHKARWDNTKLGEK